MLVLLHGNFFLWLRLLFVEGAYHQQNCIMADSCFVPGFVFVGIQMATNRILHHINLNPALRCRKELVSLNNQVMRIEPIITNIQQYRLHLNIIRAKHTDYNDHEASVVKGWLKKLEALLQEASEAVQQCTNRPRFRLNRANQTRGRISNLISNIEKHLKLVPSNLPLSQSMQIGSTNSSASTSQQGIFTPITGFFMEERCIVGQEKEYAKLEELVMGNSHSLIGVVGKGGSGKTLLLKRVFNSQNVRHLFCNGLLLWLTVPHSPSFICLRNELCSQTALQTKEDLDRHMDEEKAKNWLNERLRRLRFALFLDDVRGEGAQLLEELDLVGLQDNLESKVIVSSRDDSVLLQWRVEETCTIRMQDLMKDESWRLFSYHAFNDNPPTGIDVQIARPVCDNCAGLPLVIKVVGNAMAGIVDSREWETAAMQLPKVESQEDQDEGVYKRLRLSYNALRDVELQLCFLYAAAAFREDQIVHAEAVIPLWIGEGLLARKQHVASYDPVEIGRNYIDILASRCLIEPKMRDIHGRVVCFSMHHVLRDWAIQIARREENFYCEAGRGLTGLNENEYSGGTRIFLNDNRLSSLPISLKGSQMCSLLIPGNNDFTKIPKGMIRSMVSLKVLDLSWTSLPALPDSMGCLKQLICLRLQGMPIKKLPASLKNLVNLEILDLACSSITELPCGLHKLTSLMFLGLDSCKDLKYLPGNISGLKSLQYLGMNECSNLWTKGKRKTVASINDLGSLIKLKKLGLEYNAQTVPEGTWGAMTQIEVLHLTFTKMECLPQDMTNMSRLRKLHLQCPQLIRMECKFSEFQNLSHLRLFGCMMLEEISYLDNLGNLKQLEIIQCPKVKKFSQKFGETGAFSSLDSFSLVQLDELEELPILEIGAFPSLKMLIMIDCENAYHDRL